MDFSPQKSYLNVLVLDIILIICKFLPTSIDVQNLGSLLCIKDKLANIIEAKSREELTKTIFANPFYPKNVKRKICEGETQTYILETIIDVFIGDEKIGFVERKFYNYNPSLQYWCGYFYLPNKFVKKMMWKTVLTCIKIGLRNDGNNYLQFYCGEIEKFLDPVKYHDYKFGHQNEIPWIGWGQYEETLEKYQTLDSVIDKIKCFHMKILMG